MTGQRTDECRLGTGEATVLYYARLRTAAFTMSGLITADGKPHRVNVPPEMRFASARNDTHDIEQSLKGVLLFPNGKIVNVIRARHRGHESSEGMLLASSPSQDSRPRLLGQLGVSSSEVLVNSGISNDGEWEVGIAWDAETQNLSIGQKGAPKLPVGFAIPKIDVVRTVQYNHHVMPHPHLWAPKTSEVAQAIYVPRH